MKRSISRLYSKPTRSMKSSYIREMLQKTKGVPGMISFAGGLPSPETFPKDLLAELFAVVIKEEGDDVLQYGPSEGDNLLRQVLKRLEGVPALSEKEIMITVGSTNGIYVFSRTLIDSGDIVICEAPAFTGSLAAMEDCGARIYGIEMDDFGMRPERLREVLKGLVSNHAPVKFIYVIPDFQNPSGRTMDLYRRREIIEIAQEYDLPILEDQPYRELRFDGDPISTLWELARTEFDDPQRVTLCKSFSKILGPGLRLGYVMGPSEILGPMVKWAQKMTVSPGCVAQRVAARLIEKGYIGDHVSRIVEIYRPRRDAMFNALKTHMPEGVRWTVPEGGIFIWVTLDNAADTDELLDRALEEKVAFIPGSKFYPEGTTRKNEMRLNFSYSNVDFIEEGIARLAGLL